MTSNFAFACSLGSSPRGRGKHMRDLGDRIGNRLIPAWAGKTWDLRVGGETDWAHPRVGGENSIEETTGALSAGSSPRGRGKLHDARQEGNRAGLIPAWAGKTRALDASPVSLAAHPRVGGENQTRTARPSLTRGSSPRGRGKPTVSEIGAGKKMAHPRVGGENLFDKTHVTSRRGSSPRGRGKRRGPPGRPEEDGLIPAWAGKTLRSRFARTSPTAHPRVGGENLHAFDEPVARSGSSPRGRGKQRGSWRNLYDARLIPAWAGKTSLRSPRTCPDRAHPRVGGENVLAISSNLSGSGSSPRGRGKRLDHVPAAAFDGLIPAWAGKTRSGCRTPE